MEQKRNVVLQKTQSTSEVEIEDSLEKKIRYLCNKFPNTEWSGALFYKTEGDIKNGIKIFCKDLLLLDIGTVSYTEWEMCPDVFAYQIANDDELSYEIGFIHSHNKMNTFFSETDLDTLKTFGTERVHLLSLIVNNNGNYNAAYTEHATIKEKQNKQITYYTENGISNLTKIEESEYELVKAHFMNVVIHNEQTELQGQIDSILKAKKEAETIRFENMKSKQKKINKNDRYDDDFILNLYGNQYPENYYR